MIQINTKFGAQNLFKKKKKKKKKEGGVYYQLLLSLY